MMMIICNGLKNPKESKIKMKIKERVMWLMGKVGINWISSKWIDEY